MSYTDISEEEAKVIELIRSDQWNKLAELVNEKHQDIVLAASNSTLAKAIDTKNWGLVKQFAFKYELFAYDAAYKLFETKESIDFINDNWSCSIEDTIDKKRLAEVLYNCPYYDDVTEYIKNSVRTQLIVYALCQKPIDWDKANKYMLSCIYSESTYRLYSILHLIPKDVAGCIQLQLKECDNAIVTATTKIINSTKFGPP